MMSMMFIFNSQNFQIMKNQVGEYQIKIIILQSWHAKQVQHLEESLLAPKIAQRASLNYLQKIKSYQIAQVDCISFNKMNKNINDFKLVLVSNNLSRFNQTFAKCSQSNTTRKAQLSQKIIPSKQKYQILPEISSPSLKQTIYNMFSQRRLKQLQPILHLQPRSKDVEQNIPRSKSLTISLKEGNFLLSRKSQPKSRQAKQFIVDQILPKRTHKIFIQSKSKGEKTKIEPLDLKDSFNILLNNKNQSNLEQTPNHINDEQSQQNQQASNITCSKLQEIRLSKKFEWKQKEAWPQKSTNNQSKSSGFVMRQKLAKEMYKNQRDQIKLVKQVIQSSKGLSLSKDLNVKNYASFFPKIITIEN